MRLGSRRTGATTGSRTSKPKSKSNVTRNTAKSSISLSTRIPKATSTSSSTQFLVVRKLSKVLTVAVSTTARSWPRMSSTRSTTPSGALPRAGSRWSKSLPFGTLSLFRSFAPDASFLALYFQFEKRWARIGLVQYFT